MDSLVSDWIYIVESITRNWKAPSPPDTEARSVITRRDGGKCCVTGRAGTLLDPLVVTLILPIPVGWLADKVFVFRHQNSCAAATLARLSLAGLGSSTCLVPSSDRTTGTGGFLSANFQLISPYTNH
ncbi:hypothetical protein VUR80DRAFT_8382 [Thermomyces stellatus]